MVAAVAASTASVLSSTASSITPISTPVATTAPIIALFARSASAYTPVNLTISARPVTTLRLSALIEWPRSV